LNETAFPAGTFPHQSRPDGIVEGLFERDSALPHGGLKYALHIRIQGDRGPHI
jgi:hypothetical protein